LQTVIDQYELRVERRGLSVGGGFIHDGISAAFLQSLYSELITIERLTFQGKEDTTLGAVSRVGGNTWMLLVKFIKFLNIHCYFMILTQRYKKTLNSKL
jgi:hypothetical protein